MQADPLVEDANLVQGLNRYSYVLNNPLSLTDPTGYLSWSEARPVVAIVAAIVMQNYAGAAYAAMGITSGLAQATITGAITGAIGGGSRGAVMGAFGGAMFYGIGSAFQDAAFMNNLGSVDGNYAGAFGTNLTGAQFAAKVALHGMAGGVMSSLEGGNFGHGFASAAVAQLSSARIDQIGRGAPSHAAHRIAAAAVIGGTMAELTGGKFANGAVTAAFSAAFSSGSGSDGSDSMSSVEVTGCGSTRGCAPAELFKAPWMNYEESPNVFLDNAAVRALDGVRLKEGEWAGYIVWRGPGYVASTPQFFPGGREAGTVPRARFDIASDAVAVFHTHPKIGIDRVDRRQIGFGERDEVVLFQRPGISNYLRSPDNSISVLEMRSIGPINPAIK